MKPDNKKKRPPFKGRGNKNDSSRTQSRRNSSLNNSLDINLENRSNRRKSVGEDELKVVKYGEIDDKSEPMEASLRYSSVDPVPQADELGDDVYCCMKCQWIPEKDGQVESFTPARWGVPRKVSWFSSGETRFQKGQQVVVDTEKGQFLGEVVSHSSIRRETNQSNPRHILRIATPEDIETEARHQELALKAMEFAKTRIAALELDMDLFYVSVLHSGDKILFYFTSDNRVDFRRLVRDLAARYSMRIEMRQMGVRDDAKVLGGLGPCGKELCCSTHLNKFVPVSIRMAKDQNLVLNPQNVSGQCSRLKCCLAYEQPFYQEMRKGLPRVGKKVKTPEGIAKVLDVNVLKNVVRCEHGPGNIKVWEGGDVSKLGGPENDVEEDNDVSSDLDNLE
ncbi:hypothetical protein KKF34_19395 [Myxococcota bacterium]|nr:hypothetical protein [Myxococcota bacterium]MBU1383123.1 hypothetical protein [Myxococcota bacterium]MBU1499054.1 hypothetical protein [Myxococcota bacterium]